MQFYGVSLSTLACGKVEVVDVHLHALILMFCLMYLEKSCEPSPLANLPLHNQE